VPEGSETGAAVPALKQHDHACWSYQSDAERGSVLSGFFADGLATHERLYYFGATGDDEHVLQGLAAAGYDPSQLLESAALVIADVEQAYFPDGSFNARANLEGFRALARQAVDDGFRGIRVAAENAVVLHHPQIEDSWFDYELQVDALVAAEPIVGLCCFDRRQCDQPTLALLDAVHLLQHDPSASAPQSPFHVHTADADVLVLTGDIDAFGAEALSRLLRSAADRRERLRLDLRGLHFLDAAGMRTLEDVSRDRAPRHGPLEVQGVTPFQLRVWQMSGHPEAVTLVSG
jgi:anti-anti-sigma factor